MNRDNGRNKTVKTNRTEADSRFDCSKTTENSSSHSDSVGGFQVWSTLKISNWAFSEKGWEQQQYSIILLYLWRRKCLNLSPPFLPFMVIYFFSLQWRAVSGWTDTGWSSWAQFRCPSTKEMMSCVQLCRRYKACSLPICVSSKYKSKTLTSIWTHEPADHYDHWVMVCICFPRLPPTDGWQSSTTHLLPASWRSAWKASNFRFKRIITLVTE